MRSTVFTLNRRNRCRRWPKTKYWRQMVERFRNKPRGSRHRRVPAHNLMLLAATG